MIPVAAAPEPAQFDKLVRQPGLAAIDELIGRTPRSKRPGPRRPKVADRPDAIPPEKYPDLWRRALPDMMESYRRVCAYLSLYIEHATGSGSVDHVVPKVRSWDLVYEWSNYRLCAALINARKGVLESVLDPFTIEDGWFALELVAFQVIVGPTAPPTMIDPIQSTITDLGLNIPECLKARAEYVDCYEDRQISLDYMTRRAPFIASELRRQGKLLHGDT